MDTSLSPSPTPKWTYADLISSYRFWGIVIFYILIMGCLWVFNSMTPLFLRQQDILSTDLSRLLTIRQIGMFVAVLVAWPASRIKNYYPLYVFAGFLILGSGLVYLKTDSTIALYLGEFLAGLSQGCIVLLVPAYIAGATASVELFVIAFGLCTFLNFLISSYLLTLMSRWYGYGSDVNPTTAYLFVLVPVIVGMLFLLPIKRRLFHESPRVRKSTAQPPVRVEPLVVLLLCLIPFYCIFWFVRIHREMWSFTNTPRLMTAEGAGWSVFFAPLAMPVIFSILNDELRELLLRKGQQPGYKTGWVILFALLFPPISAAIVQSQMNRLNQ